MKFSMVNDVYFISPHDGNLLHNCNNIVSGITLLCFIGVCDEETIAFPKRWNTKNFNSLQCGSMYQGFFEISLHLQEVHSLPFQLILSLCHQNKLQFVFRQELSLWSKNYSWVWPVSYSDKSVPQMNFVFKAVKFYNWLHKDIAAAQHVAHLTDQWLQCCLLR